jgi:hypothetical protein
MSNTQENRNETRSPARLAAAILFVLMLGTGYTISPPVEGAVARPTVAEEQDPAELAYLPSECMIDGLAFSDCNLDF